MYSPSSNTARPGRLLRYVDALREEEARGFEPVFLTGREQQRREPAFRTRADVRTVLDQHSHDIEMTFGDGPEPARCG